MSSAAEVCRHVEVGLNTNVDLGGEVSHVQTVDLGFDKAELVTQVFGPGGNVVRTVRFDYRKYAAHPRLPGILPEAMRRQHESVVRQLLVEAGQEVSQPQTPGPVLVSVGRSEDGGSLDQQVEAAGWDRLLERARASRQRPPVPWDQIVESCRGGDRGELSPGEQDAESAFREAQRLLSEGDDEGALSSYARAVYLRPQDPRYRSGLYGLLSRLRWTR
jgi:hypothetical protein